MRPLAYTTLSISVCAFFVYFLVAESRALQADQASAWLGVAGVLVAVSVLAEIIFAVIVYLEATTLRNMFGTLKRDMQNQHDRHKRELLRLNDGYYRGARAALEGLMEAFNNYQEGDVFKIAMENLKIAQINVDLAHGSPSSLRAAIQSSFKRSHARFLELHDVVWERTEGLDEGERNEVRRFYRELRDIVLAGMPR